MDKEMAEDDLEMVVVMRIDLHCEACCEEIKRRVLKIKGVEEVVPHMKSSQVTVRGKIEPATLAGLIHKWTGRRAAIFRAEPLLQQPSPSPPPSPPKVDEGHPEAAPEPVPEKEETKEGDQPPSSDDAQEKEGAAAEEKEKEEEEGEPVDEEEEGRGELQNENPIVGAAGSSNGAAEESHTATTTNGHLFRAAVQEPVAAVAPESEKTATGNQLYQCRYYYYPAYTYDAYPCPQYRDQFQQQNYSYAAGYPPAMYGYYPRHVPEAFSDENPNVCSVM
uniref:HMA domain-containing protein n=2 Tax=Oryza brachyantha TaxID=4533 RepID=J3MK53_ORYBR